MNWHSEMFGEIDLGLDDWQLFLNLGLLYLEAANVHEAMQVLRLATLLAPDRAETHFNLGSAWREDEKYTDAERTHRGPRP